MQTFPELRFKFIFKNKNFITAVISIVKKLQKLFYLRDKYPQTKQFESTLIFRSCFDYYNQENSIQALPEKNGT